VFGTIVVMPRISEFYGIVIEMYFADHPPPHFHARYSGDEALIVIETGEVFAGFLPGGAPVGSGVARGAHGRAHGKLDRASAQQPTEPVAPLT
jgi:hypothetical protein